MGEEDKVDGALTVGLTVMFRADQMAAIDDLRAELQRDARHSVTRGEVIRDVLDDGLAIRRAKAEAVAV